MNAKGVSLHVELHGTGESVLLLHGWPDTSAVWQKQVPALVAAGYQAIAQDLRGFGRSDKPADPDLYSTEHVVGDAIGVLDAANVDRAHIVGHGWGAFVAWMTGILHPERVRTLVVLGVPHPSAIPAETGIQAWEKTWYRWLYQFPNVADAWLADDDWNLFREFLRVDPFLTEDQIDGYVAQMSEPGALTASLNWFRALEPIETAPAATEALLEG